VSGAVATAPYALCDACGVEHCRHFDGWNGTALGCEETSRRWGGHYAAPVAEADDVDLPADWMYHDGRCASRQVGSARGACDCGVNAAAPAPVLPRRCYTFAVYVSVPVPVDENDVDGFTEADAQALVQRTLASYAGPQRADRLAVVDFELMTSEPESAAFASRR